MTLADYTSPEMIVPYLRGRDVAAVLQELSHVLHRERRVPDLLPFYHAALNREFLASTDAEAGMACPHARVPGLPALCYALGRSQEPIGWGHRVAPTVRLVFLIAVPATDAIAYLLLTSGLARLAKEPGLVQRLHQAPDTFEILEVLKQIELRTSRHSELTLRAEA
jgi:PTS system nitrogen regulatory IIA component